MLSALAGAEEDIVGPADVGGERCGGGDGFLCGEAGGEREPEGFVDGKLRRDEGADVETVAGSGVPDVTAAAAAGELLIGDPDAAARTCGGGGEGKGIGGFHAREVDELVVELCAGEQGVESCEVEWGHERQAVAMRMVRSATTAE